MKNLLAAFIVMALLLQGCSWIESWGDDEPNAPAPLVEFETSLKVKKVWSVNVGDGMGKQGLSMAPRYSSGTIVTADYKGKLVSVDADTGRKNWELKTEQPFSGGPGLDDRQIYMGTIDGRVIAYDRDSGTELWNAQVSSEVLAPPASADGIVVVRCIDGRVFGLDEINGRRIWIYDHSVPLLTLRGNADLLVRAGVVFVGYDDGSVVSLKLEDGSLIWNQTIVSPEGRTGWVQEFVLDNGQRLDADMVILATGIRPNLAWLDGSGVEVDQGVLVDDRLQLLKFFLIIG